MFKVGLRPKVWRALEAGTLRTPSPGGAENPAGHCQTGGRWRLLQRWRRALRWDRSTWDVSLLVYHIDIDTHISVILYYVIYLLVYNLWYVSLYFEALLFTNCTSDSISLYQDPENAGAVFQVCSLFQLLGDRGWLSSGGQDRRESKKILQAVYTIKMYE